MIAGIRDEDVGRGFAALLARLRADRTLPPAIMGIVNVTPDSFSDGGLFADADAAIAQARRLAAEGAAILDIGGESTRRGATAVTADEETRRVLPVVEALTTTGALISIDTMKGSVAEAALSAGAHIVNDVRGLQGDPAIAEIAARSGAGIVVMHNPGVLGSAKPLEADPIEACLAFFARSLDIARSMDVREDRIALDPGFGFGKSVEQNVELLARLPELFVLGLPIVVGASRKSFIGKVTGNEAKERLAGTLAANVAAALFGAAVVRVHDVAPHVEALRMAAAIRVARPGSR